MASDSPMPDQRVGDEPPLLLADGEHADLAVGVGQRAADAVEADAARDLLDQVDLAVEVGAEGGDDRDHVVAGRARLERVEVVGVELDAERRQRSPHVLGVEVGAEHRVHPAGPQADAGALDRRRVDVDGVGRDLRARRPRRAAPWPARRCAAIAVGVDAPLEARARLAAQLEPLGAAGDAHALEVRRLQEDLGGGVGHLRRGAAHDPGDGLRRALARRR